jgi:hypothetical protein
MRKSIGYACLPRSAYRFDRVTTAAGVFSNCTLQTQANPHASFLSYRTAWICVVLSSGLKHYRRYDITGVGNLEKKSKPVPITGRGGVQGCEMLRIPHCLDNRLTVNWEILATCSNTYSPVRTSQEAHSVSIK